MKQLSKKQREQLNEAIRKWLPLKEERDELERDLKAQRKIIDDLLGELPNATTDEFVINHPQKSRTGIDAKRLRADLPEVAAAYETKTNYRQLYVEPRVKEEAA
jgi:predicted phage-related endonuclease